jgi:hypothetical protein
MEQIAVVDNLANIAFSKNTGNIFAIEGTDQDFRYLKAIQMSCCGEELDCSNAVPFAVSHEDFEKGFKVGLLQ